MTDEPIIVEAEQVAADVTILDTFREGKGSIVARTPKKEIVETSEDKPKDVDATEEINSIKAMVDIGVDATEDLVQICKMSEHPRAFEVLSTLMRTVIDGNKTIHDMKTGKGGTSNNGNATTIDNRTQNNVVVNMPTSELMNLISEKDNLNE